MSAFLVSLSVRRGEPDCVLKPKEIEIIGPKTMEEVAKIIGGKLVKNGGKEGLICLPGKCFHKQKQQGDKDTGPLFCFRQRDGFFVVWRGEPVNTTISVRKI